MASANPATKSAIDHDKVTALPKRPTQINDSHMKESQYMRNRWSVKPSVGTPVEAVLNPLYWTHVTTRLRPGDLVEVVPEDRSFFAELFVTNVEKTSANVVLLRHIPLQMDDLAGIEDLAAYDIKWAGVAKWRAVRKIDGSIVITGLESKDAVIAELRALQKG